MAAPPPAVSASVNVPLGAGLATLSAIFIGASFIIKKLGLKQAGTTGVSAADGGFGYLRQPLWWLGLLTMGAGEACNIVAYGFAPAAAVTPLGAFSILVAALLAHFILKERLNRFGWLGGVICIAGSIVVVLHVPEEPAVTSLDEIVRRALRWPFLTYAITAVVLSIILAVFVDPRVGKRHPVVPILICSLVGSVSVSGIKAVALAVRLTIAGSNQFKRAAPYIFILFTVAAVTVQLLYLNRALDAHPAAVVTPTYYALFTFLTIVAAAILYSSVPASVADGITAAAGFVCVVAAVVLLYDGVDTKKEKDDEEVQLADVHSRVS